MSLETIALISLLTLLPFCLGSDIFLLLVLNPVLFQVSNQSRLDAIGALQAQGFKTMARPFEWTYKGKPLTAST